MSIFVLPHDAWAASLQNAAATCVHVHDRVWSNSALWSLQAGIRWRSCSQWGIVDDWTGLYRAGHLAACRLSTNEPWSASIPRPVKESPLTANVMVKYSSSGYRAPPSTIHPISTVSSRPAPFLTLPDVVTASLEQHLHFWAWGPVASTDTDADAGATAATAAAAAGAGAASSSGGGGLSQALRNPAGFASGVSGGARHLCSHAQYGHTGSIDVLVEMPGSGVLGVATGSRDHTVKLRAPFDSGGVTTTSSSAVGRVRPVRTLRGHTGRITALATVRTDPGATDASGSGSFTVLASSSTDRTIKLWDASVLLHLPPAAYHAGSSYSDGHMPAQQGYHAHAVRRRAGGGGAAAVAKQQGHQPLLGTLRGHSDAVTSVLRWDEGRQYEGSHSRAPGGSSSLSQGCGLVSCGKDGRVKLWDVTEGRNSCVATWRLPDVACSLIDMLFLQGCVTVRMPGGLQIVDVRSPGSGSVTSHGVVSVNWAGCHLAAAEAHGTILAAGDCQGVRAWDVRMISSNPSCACTSASTSGSRGASSELFTGRLPNREPVSLLHMDRVEVVAATNTSTLHSPASIAVWSLPCGQRVQLLSSTLSAVTLHGRSKVMTQQELAAARATAWQVMDSMSEEDADKVLTLLHRQHRVQQQQQQQQGQQGQQQGVAIPVMGQQPGQLQLQGVEEEEEQEGV